MSTMRELKGRIASVHSSQKITGAMKMISSARLRKAESKLIHSQPYRERLWEIYGHIIASGCDYESPLVMQRKILKRVDLVVFASDEGLCGAFNINLYKKLLEVVRRYKEQRVGEIVVYSAGKKIREDVKRIPGIRAVDVAGLFSDRDDTHATQELADRLIRSFESKKTDRVEMIYAHYKSIGTQIVTERRFLPVETEESAKQEISQQGQEPWYIYEPDCATILNTLYPLILHALMYEGFLESRTSEQAARILSMQTANDNANKLLSDLQLEYNKLRQQGITTELLDIAGGSVRNE